MSEAVIRPAGDSALLVEFENEISLEVNSRVRALKYTLEQSPFEGMGELVHWSSRLSRAWANWCRHTGAF